jgi:hypothetical protein
MDEMTDINDRTSVLNDAAQLHALLESAAHSDRDAGSGITEQYAEELIASIRLGRG